MRLALPILVVLALVPAARAGCPDGQTAAFMGRGSYGVGVRTLPLVDTSRPTAAHGDVPQQDRRLLTTEVWYPTAGSSGGAPVRDAAIAPGRFPLVAWSHGLLDAREGEAYVAIALASRGFVVAAPDFPLTNGQTPRPLVLGDLANQPGDVRFVIDTLLALDRTPGAWLEGSIRRNRIGAGGLSYGGATTILVGYHPTLRDRRVRAIAPIAPASCFFSEEMYRHARPPVLIVQGDEDLIVPLETNGARTFTRAASQRTLVTLTRGTHTAMAGPIAFPSATSYDQIGCSALGTVLPNAGIEGVVSAFAPGIIDLVGCGLPCEVPTPDHAPMQALRMHDLTVAAVTAFFEATLRGSTDARCFLNQKLAAENPDVDVVSRRRSALRR